MTAEDEPEFTHKQGLAVGCVTVLFGGSLILFGGEQWFQPGIIAFGAIATTLFIQRRLLRRPWFMAFVALMVIAHLGLVLAFPATDLSREEVNALAFADIVGVLALAFGLEKLMLRRG
jgi:hypothetical protein